MRIIINDTIFDSDPDNIFCEAFEIEVTENALNYLKTIKRLGSIVPVTLSGYTGTAKITRVHYNEERKTASITVQWVSRNK